MDKDALAREIARKYGVAADGSIGMLGAMECCVAPSVVPNKKTKLLEVDIVQRKCVSIYFYFDHPEVGFGHVRLQTWAPYAVQICLNGRHWLEKQLAAAGIGYRESGNCFPWIDDVARESELLSFYKVRCCFISIYVPSNHVDDFSYSCGFVAIRGSKFPAP